jgi:hypothetical protein
VDKERRESGGAISILFLAFDLFIFSPQFANFEYSEMLT